MKNLKFLIKFFEKNEEKFEKFVENFLSVLAVVETGPSLLEFLRVSGGGRGTFPRFPPGAATEN